MSKARVVNDQEGKFFGVQITCLGCRWFDGEPMHHTLQTDWMPPGAVRTPGARPDLWGFNGDLDRPVFTPSLLCQSTQGPDQTPHVCHSFIGCNGAQPGQITYLPDCTHGLAGQTIDLPEMEPKT